METVSNQLVQMKSACDKLIEDFSETLFMAFIQQAPRDLINDALKLHSFSDSAPLLSFAKDIETMDENCRVHFLNHVREFSNQLSSDNETDEMSKNSYVLELVDEDVFDEWLKISSLSKNIESNFDPILSECIAKYEHLIHQTRSTEIHTFKPLVFMKALQKTYKSFDQSVSIYVILYMTMKDCLSRMYPDFLDAFSEQTKTIRIVKSNVGHVQKHSSAQKGLTPDASSKENESEVNSSSAGVTAPAVMAGNHSRSLSGSMHNSGASQQYPQQYSQQNSQQYDADLQGLMSLLNSHTRHAQKGKQTLTQHVNKSNLSHKNSFQLLSKFSQALTGKELSNANAQQVVSENSSADHSPQVNISDLVEGLQYVIKQENFQPTKQQSNAPSEKVKEYLVKQRGIQSGIPEEYQGSLDGAAYLFTRARAEYEDESDIRSLLKRLEKPILKLMLTDNDFMTSPNHPARDVLNLIDECSMATNSEGRIVDSRLQRFLAIQVDDIDNNFANDPSIFEKVRTKLIKVVLPIRRSRKNRMFTVQQKLQSQQLVNNARTRIDAFIESSLPGNQRPQILNEIFEKGWYQYLILQQLSTDHIQRSETTSIIELVINILLGEIKVDAKEQADLIEALIKGFKSIGADTHTLKVMKAYLADELNKPIETVQWHDYPIIQPDIVEVPVIKTMQPLEPGTWWHFNKNNRWQSGQLIWKSRNGAQLGFVNRSASENWLISLKAFAAQFLEEQIRDFPQQGLPLMERSEYGLFDDSYRDMIHQAMHDPVTDLLNRKGLVNRIIQLANTGGIDTTHCICQIDFDQVQIVYMNCGASAGDKLVSNIASIIQSNLVNQQALAQVNNESFLLFLPDCKKETAESLGIKLLKELSNYRFEHGREIYSIGVNIGLLEFSPTLLNIDHILSKVDSACETSKLEGRNNLLTYSDEDLYLQAQQAMKEWAGRIDRILEHEGLYLRCQQVNPINKDSELVPYYEILLGIKDITDKDSDDSDHHFHQVSPSHFFPAVELWKRSYEVDMWVLRAVFKWIREHADLFKKVGGFAINLSAQSLNNIVILDYLRTELTKGDLPNTKITFEITETAAIESYGKAQEFMHEIRELGCEFSLDDFGAGFSSYSHLKNLKTNTMKIDGSFVKDIVESATDRMMVKSMHELGKFLGMKTVAEFVESLEILEILKEIGVDYAQGYALHKPMPITDLEKALAD